MLLHFLVTPYEVEKYVELNERKPEAKIMMQSGSSDDYVQIHDIEILNLFHQKLQLINAKPLIKNKLKDLLGELKKFKIQTILKHGDKSEKEFY